MHFSRTLEFLCDRARTMFCRCLKQCEARGGWRSFLCDQHLALLLFFHRTGTCSHLAQTPHVAILCIRRAYGWHLFRGKYHLASCCPSDHAEPHSSSFCAHLKAYIPAYVVCVVGRSCCCSKPYTGWICHWVLSRRKFPHSSNKPSLG